MACFVRIADTSQPGQKGIARTLLGLPPRPRFVNVERSVADVETGNATEAPRHPGTEHPTDKAV